MLLPLVPRLAPKEVLFIFLLLNMSNIYCLNQQKTREEDGFKEDVREKDLEFAVHLKLQKKEKRG